MEIREQLIQLINKKHGLKWLPFIGDKYYENPRSNRLLIIGESQYHRGTPESRMNCQDINSTIYLIDDAIEENDSYTKVYRNTFNTLIQNGGIDIPEFWDLVCYYNFIQRCLNTNQERPTNEDFILGWNGFFELIEVLNPGYCLFLGVRASDFLEYSIYSNSDNVELLKYEWGSEAINGTFPRHAELRTKGNQIINLFFIKHPNRFFTTSLWSKCLQQNMGGLIKSLDRGVDR